MKTFYRVVSSIAAVAIGVGLVLGIVGVGLGASLGELENYAHTRSLFDFHVASDLWGNETVEKSFTGVTRLDIDLSAANVQLVEGDCFAIKAEQVRASRLTAQVDNGTLNINNNGNRETRGWSRNHGGNRIPTITITLPKGFVAQEANLFIGMGEFTGAGISAQRSTLEVGMGQMTITSMTSGPCDITVGMGELNLEGIFTGASTVDCGMGEANIAIAGDPTQYGYDVTVGMGDVEVNGKKIGGMGGMASAGSGTENFFTIDCGMGTVKLTIAP